MQLFLTLTLLVFSQVLLADSIFLIPGETWGFQFDSPKLVNQKGDASAIEYQLQASTKSGFFISAFVEPANGKGTDSASCMKYYWALASKSPMIQKDTIKILASDQFSVVSYLVEGEYKGGKLIQPSVNYYGYRDGKCIDFHISQAFPFDAKIDYSNLINFEKTFGYYK